MRARGNRRVFGLIFLVVALVAAALAIYTQVGRDNGPVGSYVALALVFAGTSLVFLTTTSDRGGR